MVRRELEGTAYEVLDEGEDKERALEIAEDLSNIREDLDNLHKSVSKQHDKESPGRRSSETD